MSIYYCGIARDQDIILSEYTEYYGNSEQIARHIFSILHPEEQSTFRVKNGMRFHVFNEGRLSFLCLVNGKISTNKAFEFLYKMRNKFIMTYSEEMINTSRAHQINFAYELGKSIKQYHSDLSFQMMERSLNEELGAVERVLDMDIIVKKQKNYWSKSDIESKNDIYMKEKSSKKSRMRTTHILTLTLISIITLGIGSYHFYNLNPEGKWIWKDYKKGLFLADSSIKEKDSGKLRTKNRTYIWGHRGASGYLKGNSLESFILAIEQGADGLESDVQMSKDGVTILHHSSHLLYQNISIPIHHLTLQQIMEVNTQHKLKIPTVREVFTYFRLRKNKYGEPICFSLDLKHMNLGSGEDVIRIAKELNIEDNIYITMSGGDDNYWEYVEKYRSLSSSINLVNSIHSPYIIPPFWIFGGLPSGDAYFNEWEKFREFGFVGMNTHFEGFSQEMLDSTRERGFMLWVWGCNTNHTILKYLHLGVDAIYTNYADVAVHIRHNITNNHSILHPQNKI